MPQYIKPSNITLTDEQARIVAETQAPIKNPRYVDADKDMGTAKNLGFFVACSLVDDLVCSPPGIVSIPSKEAWAGWVNRLEQAATPDTYNGHYVDLQDPEHKGDNLRSGLPKRLRDW